MCLAIVGHPVARDTDHRGGPIDELAGTGRCRVVVVIAAVAGNHVVAGYCVVDDLHVRRRNGGSVVGKAGDREAVGACASNGCRQTLQASVVGERGGLASNVSVAVEDFNRGRCFVQHYGGQCRSRWAVAVVACFGCNQGARAACVGN